MKSFDAHGAQVGELGRPGEQEVKPMANQFCPNCKSSEVSADEEPCRSCCHAYHGHYSDSKPNPLGSNYQPFAVEKEPAHTSCRGCAHTCNACSNCNSAHRMWGNSFCDTCFPEMEYGAIRKNYTPAPVAAPISAPLRKCPRCGKEDDELQKCFECGHEWYKGQEFESLQGEILDTPAPAPKIPAIRLYATPFPDCAKNCAAVETLGCGECESVCPHKFDSKGEPKQPAPEQAEPRWTVGEIAKYAQWGLLNGKTCFDLWKNINDPHDGIDAVINKKENHEL